MPRAWDNQTLAGVLMCWARLSLSEAFWNLLTSLWQPLSPSPAYLTEVFLTQGVMFERGPTAGPSENRIVN